MNYSSKIRLTFEVNGIVHRLSHVGPHAFIFRPIVHFPKGTTGTLRIDIDNRAQVRECVLTQDTDELGCAKYDITTNPVDKYLTSNEQTQPADGWKGAALNRPECGEKENER